MSIAFLLQTQKIFLKADLEPDPAHFDRSGSKSTKLWWPFTFDPLDGFSNFKKVKHSKFWALSIGSRYGSGPMDRAWNFECFTFLKFENPSSGSKVKGHQSMVLLVRKL